MVSSSKHVLVVGASSGIGLGIAKELALIVAKLTLCSRSHPVEVLETNKTNKTINPSVEVVREKLDVSLLHEIRNFTTKYLLILLTFLVVSVARFMLVHDMLEGLNRPGVRVLNVLAGGIGGAIDVDDLDLKHTYSTKRSLSMPPRLPSCMGTRHAPESCSNYMVSGLLNGDYATGWYLLNRNAEVVSKTQYHTEELKDIVWKHTLKTTNDIIKQ
ncbi:hypothetical protein BBJ29_009219 [Phytophthora kernoviae]|uniref:Uncharacterized protein n=1 Tax=Phytophthora kernoviae TaxID=325452 RepID=A0A3F2RIS0_9STRA|nr:hypothetical protein BBJ29_009219 [Phytophthora kernoviae]RLN57869.1 hypothetical protein BBP00_00007301 [Phytophthora kernoviae]